MDNNFLVHDLLLDEGVKLMSYYAVLKRQRSNEYYGSEEYNDHFLFQLGLIFWYGLPLSNIKAAIKDSTIDKIENKSIRLKFLDDVVSIEDPKIWFKETIYIQIGRQKLLNFINQWEEIIKSNPDEVILHRDDDYNVWFEQKFYETKKKE